MTDSKKPAMHIWAVAGLLFIINSVMTVYLVDDDGFLASVCGGIAVLLPAAVAPF